MFRRNPSSLGGRLILLVLVFVLLAAGIGLRLVGQGPGGPQAGMVGAGVVGLALLIAIVAVIRRH